MTYRQFRPTEAVQRHLGNQPNQDKRDIVQALYEQGLTIRQVAAQVGISYQAVHQMLVRIGVPLRSRGGNTGPHSRHKK